jgi:hypothetical protein
LLELASGQSFQPAGGFDSTLPGRFSNDGQFATPSTWPGRYLVRAGGVPPGWIFKSATSQGRDISETPIDLTGDLNNVVITFTDRSAKIDGTVEGADGQADDGAIVLLFPTDSAAWTDYGRTSRRVRSAPAPGGRFTVPAPPEGEYFLVAIPDEEAVDWQNPTFLGKVAGLADRIGVVEAQSLTHALRTKRVQ